MTMLGRDNHQLLPSGLGGGGGGGGGGGFATPMNRLEDVPLTDLFGGTIDPGTDGESILEWGTIGSFLFVNIFISFDTDAVFPSGGPINIISTDLPFSLQGGEMGTLGAWSRPGAYGFITDAAFSAFTDDVVPIATSTGAILFVASRLGGGVAGLWSPTVPQPLAGIQTLFQGTLVGTLDP